MALLYQMYYGLTGLSNDIVRAALSGKIQDVVRAIAIKQLL